MVMIDVNKDAPVLACSEIMIDANPEMVWNVLTDIENWPNWNPDVKNVSLDGKFEVGSKFQWKSGPGTITSTLQVVYKPKLLVWTGKTLGIKAVHVWKLEPNHNKTVISSEESWEGLIVSILKGRMQKILEESTESGLKYLKTGTEQINR